MANEGATEFGSIKAVLTLDKSDYVAGLKAAGVQADELGKHDPTIKVDVKGVPAAIAQLTAVKNAQDRLNIATARLDEVRKNGNAKRSTILAAERQVSLAMQAVAAASNKAAEGEDRLDKSNEKVAKSSKEAHTNTRALLTAIIALGPAIVPLAAATVGLGAGFAAAGVAGVLAIVGIRREMQQGTVLGQAFTAQIGLLKDNVNDLSTIAAKGVIGPFSDVVRDLQRRMPTLTSMVGEFSSVTGRTGANLLTGLVAAFVQLEPLMRTASGYTLDLSRRFEALMSGPGVVSFGSYVSSVFPQVMGDVEDIVGAVVHLVAAFAPLGTGVLGMLGALSSLISAIPVDVLATLATTAYSVYAGFKTFTLIDDLVGKVTARLVTLGVVSETAAGGVRSLTLAAGAIGAVIAVATFLYTRHAEAVRQNQQAVDAYADALRASNGAVDESITKTAAKLLQDDGALKTARELGVSQRDLTDAVLGRAGAEERVSAQLAVSKRAAVEAAAGNINAADAMGEWQKKADSLTGVIGGQNSALNEGIQKNRDFAAATQTASGAVTAQQQAQADLASKMGTTVTALQAAQDAQKKNADSAAAATAQMQNENNAAGILKGTLDLLNGETLNAAQAQNSFDSALANMGTHVDKTGKQITFTTTSIHNMSSASVALRGQLLGQVTAAQQTGEAYGQLKKSGEAGRQKLIELKKAIIENAVAHGVDRKAVTAYIDEVFKIPKSVPPTKVEIDKKAAMEALRTFQTAVNSLTGKTVQIYATAHIASVRAAGNAALANAMNTANRYATSSAYSSGRAASTHGVPKGAATGGNVGDVLRGIKGYDSGGLISGPGTGTSDSILALVNGTRDMIRVSNGEFISTAASQRRNRAALEAGNKGETLTVAGGGGGTVNLSASTIAAIAASVSRVQLRTVVTAGQFDHAMGGALR